MGAPVVLTYPATQDSADWDWIVWETLGNPDPRFQRGANSRPLGLYRMDYDKLRKAGGKSWKDPDAGWNDPPDEIGLIGGGWVKIAVVDSLDYGPHKTLIDTFLPCFSVEGGKVKEPDRNPPVTGTRTARRSSTGVGGHNTLGPPPRYIYMPFNFEDNGKSSKAYGKTPTEFKDIADQARLTTDLTRWATASRSSIVAFFDAPIPPDKHARQEWDLRTAANKTLCIEGPADGISLKTHQARHGDAKYYSVKTGVEWVASNNQGVNGKDVLESNSIHAMRRSNLISHTMNRVSTGVFEARYQIEILSILCSGGAAAYDGMQVREVTDAARNAIWFPALAIPSHGKQFAKEYGGTDKWIAFWTEFYAVPMGRAKAEMLCYFGMQHLSSNGQNFLISFKKAKGGGFNEVILRDIGDTVYNNHFFAALKDVDPIYDKELQDEIASEHGLDLDKPPVGGYLEPKMTRCAPSKVFFFDPFIKDAVKAVPHYPRVLARWCLAHNRAFADYMREKIGYSDTWSTDGSDTVSGELDTSLRIDAELSDFTSKAAYQKLIADVAALKPAKRWELVRTLEAECETVTDERLARKLVNGHEVLIGAEIEAFIKSPLGKANLEKLHAKTAVPAGAGPAMPAFTGPNCRKCGEDSDMDLTGWQRCDGCGSVYCPDCLATMRFPKGTAKVLQAMTEERRCEDCDDEITVPIG